jgi:prolyl-tRNA synthetase
MTHSDDKGLVLPPRVAPIEVVILPITKGEGEEHNVVMAKVSELVKQLKGKVRVKVDERFEMRPGAKYFEWERKGVPLRLEIGPRDVKSGTAIMAFRHNGKKEAISTESNSFVSAITEALTSTHQDLLDNAKKRLEQRTYKISNYDEMKKYMELGKSEDKDKSGFYLVPWKCDAANEAAIKEDCQATIRCYPSHLNDEPPAAGVKCFYSGQQATHMAIFARAF